MNRDSDITKSILLRLLLESDLEDASRSGDRHLTDSTLPERCRPHGFSPRDEDPKTHPLARSGPDAQPQPNPTPSIWDSVEQPIGADPNAIFNPGDLPTVQTHFEALLKRRLEQEIAHHPPLFPWEKGLQDYPDVLNPESGFASVWLDHLKNLEVPGDLPEEILSELLSQCQRVAEQTQQVGRRLVNAVEELFPDQAQTLDYVAGLISRPAYRSTQVQMLEHLDYTTASSQQQIALAMLAAQSLFEALSLTVSAANPAATRTWMTAKGPLTVTTAYLTAARLEISVKLPEAGTAALMGDAQTLTAQRSTPGDLMLCLESPQAHTPYTLAVSLTEETATMPLQFQIMVEAE